MLTRLAGFVVRLVIASAILWAVISIPLPGGRDAAFLLLLRVPIAVFVFIVYIGKTLYDSFFFERRP